MTFSYNKLATEVYDIDKPVGHSFGDVEYYLARLNSCTGPVLEPAVGSGRILIPLLEAGHTVDGIDNSEEMLSSCRKRCTERGLNPNLYQGNMQNIKLEKKYEAIIIPAGSFLLIEKKEDAYAALDNFHSHLQDGGRIIIDTFLQPDLDTGRISTKSWTTPEGDLITMESKLVEVDYIKQYSVSYLKYEKWHKGELVQTELQRFPLNWYGLEEFKLMLERTGFSDITISADYTYGLPPSNPRQTFTFEGRKV